MRNIKGRINPSGKLVAKQEVGGGQNMQPMNRNFRLMIGNFWHMKSAPNVIVLVKVLVI